MNHYKTTPQIRDAFSRGAYPDALGPEGLIAFDVWHAEEIRKAKEEAADAFFYMLQTPRDGIGQTPFRKEVIALLDRYLWNLAEDA